MQVFQKGSPMARDFSGAILTLAEMGKLKTLEEIWLTPPNECSNGFNASSYEWSSQPRISIEARHNQRASHLFFKVCM